jgi:hypothetical protein
MPQAAPALPEPNRELACAHCGRSFGCTLGGPCWCSHEDYRLPLDAAGPATDCLCPDCLRALAAKLTAERGRAS